MLIYCFTFTRLPIVESPWSTVYIYKPGDGCEPLRKVFGCFYAGRPRASTTGRHKAGGQESSQFSRRFSAVHVGAMPPK